jgi:hypothetical protein
MDMQRVLIVPLLVLACACATEAAPAPQDGQPAPAPASGGSDTAKPAPKPDAPAAEGDKDARAALEKAAARQNAGDLAEPGKLESFHVVFQKATFERERTTANGTATKEMVEVDTNGLVMRWKQGSLRTDITINGGTTSKAWYQRLGTAWIHDGKRVASLSGADRKSDYDELQFHRRVVDQLLDLAILGKLLSDGSRWTVLPDSAPYAGTVAIRRTPPADAKNPAPVTLWIEHPSADVWGDVVAASTPPSADAQATLFYEFKYHEKFPQVRAPGDDGKPAASKFRFPFQVVVQQQGAEDKKPRKVLEVFTNSVDVNSVPDGDFAQPRK